jgi:hypothetical protein
VYVLRFLRTLGWAFAVIVFAALAVAHTPVNAPGRLSLGLMYDPNDLAFLVVVLTPIGVAMWRMSSGVRRLWWLAVLVGALWLTLKTGSRGGLLGFVVVLLFLSAYRFWHREVSTRGRIVQMVFGAALALAVAIPLFNALPGAMKEQFATLENLSADYNMTYERDGRIPTWKRGIGILAARPWGVGIGSYSIAEMKASGYWHTAHNSLLQIAVELGVLGIALYLSLIFGAWRVLRDIELGRRRVPQESAAGAADPWPLLAQHLRASLIGVLVSGFFLSQAYALVTYAVIAIVAILEAMTRAPQTAAATASTAGSPAVRAALQAEPER